MKNNCIECDFIFVKKIKSNGQLMLKKQCYQCGQHDGKTYKHSDVGGTKNVGILSEFDNVKLEKYYEAQRSERKQEYQIKKDQWFEMANVYYNSDKWKIKREFVFKRDNYKCKACEVNKAEEVHHLTYSHFMNEPLFDLISVCRKCHEKITMLDRSNRNLESDEKA